MIQLSYNGELYSYDNKTSTTVSSTSSISVVLHPYVDIEGAKLFYSQGDTEGIVDITNNEAEIPGTYLVTGDLQVALKLASDDMSNLFTINVTMINSSGDVTDDDIQFTMDNKKRLILVPGSQSILAIQLDNQSEIVTFKFPRYQEEVDLSTKVPYVNYKRPQVEDLGKAFCTIEKTDDTFIYFSWMVDAAATQYSGTIQFQVEFADGEGYRWQSQIGELPILTSLYNSGLEPYTPDILEQYVQRLNNLIQGSLGIPAGGSADQILFKRSNADFDVVWKNYVGVPSGGLAGQWLTIVGGVPRWDYLPIGEDNLKIFEFTVAEQDGPYAVTSGPTPLTVIGFVDGMLESSPVVVAKVSLNGEVYFLPISAWKTGSTEAFVEFCGFTSNGYMLDIKGGVVEGTWSVSFFNQYDEAWIASFDNITLYVGSKEDLTTTAKNSIVAAINELNAGKQQKTTEITVSTAGAVTQALDAGKIYHFTGALTALTITLNAAPTGQLAQYHFDFNCGSTAPTVTLPSTVKLPDDNSFDANAHYEVDILNNYGAVISWANS